MDGELGGLGKLREAEPTVRMSLPANPEVLAALCNLEAQAIFEQ